MIARQWPKTSIARELGLGTTLRLSRDTVTAANADKVADLARRLGQRVPPPRRWRQPLPTLGALLAAEAQDREVMRMTRLTRGRRRYSSSRAITSSMYPNAAGSPCLRY